MMDVNSENYVRLLTSCIQGFHVKNSHWEQNMLPKIKKKKKRENGFDQGRAADQNKKKRSANMWENNGSNENSSIQGENANVDG